MIRILLLMDYESDFSRRFLKGLICYSKEQEPWIFCRLPAYYEMLHGKEGIVKWAKKWEADAIIARWDQEENDLLQALNIPVILQNYKQRSNFFSNLTGDYIGTGVMAAHFFIKRRFSNFAFYGDKSAVWSKERAEGFRRETERIGGNYYHLETENTRDKAWEERCIELEKWLLALPKPVGLFACDDDFALRVSEACKINDIAIPGDISLLGVDNDELICNLSDPPISSIILDVEKTGYEAGKLIHQLIRKQRKSPLNIVVKPLGIKLRQSTERYNVSDPYIREVVKQIENHFTKEISIEEFTKKFPLSRRNLETKFRLEMGISIYQFILNCRIDYLATLLANTDRTMFDIALESGFNNSKNISRVFKKLKGCTPGEYRAKFRRK